MTIRSIVRKPSDRCADCDVPCPAHRGDLSPAARAAFDAGMMQRRRVPARTEIFRQGEALGDFYFVADGWLCLYKLLPDGRRQNVKFVLPGDLVGFSLSLDREMDHTAVTLTDAVLCVGDRVAAGRHFTRDPELITHITEYLVREQEMSRDHLTSVARMTAIERVAHLICELFLRLQRRLPRRGDQMALPLTQEQMGDAIGLSAIHVNRMLSQLRAEKVVILRAGRLSVLDPARLMELANIDPAVTLGSDPNAWPSARLAV
jgi:CRP/FNR family transcriptional regulator